jgi:hypothetical protein
LLYFSKASGLLLKSQTRLKEVQTGREVNQEVFYDDYREIDGVRWPMKARLRWDDKPYAEGKTSNFKPRERLPDRLFARP